MKSPPGGGIRASPKRASSGPASRNEARIRAASPSSTSASATASAWRRISFSPLQSTLTPSRSSSATWVSVSLIRGTLESTTSSSVSRQAAIIGSAAFLFPAATISPESGAPPCMTNFSIGAEARVTTGHA